MEASEIVEIIQDFFGDRSRTPEETLEGLGEIQTEVESSIGAIEADLNREE